MPKRRDEGQKAASWVKEALNKLESLEDHPAQELFLPKGAPDWLDNIYLEFSKLVYPGKPFSKRKKEWSPTDLGAFLGRHYAMGALVEGQIPLGPKTEAELAQPKIAALAHSLLEGANAQRGSFLSLVSEVCATALQRPHAEALAFFKAFARGAEIKPDAFASEYRLTRTIRIYAVLWTIWPVIQMRPDLVPSVGALYRLLLRGIPEKDLGDFKNFEQLCRKIGLKLRGRGRPRK